MPWGGLAGWEGQFGVPALVFIFLEVDLEKTAVIQAGVAPVSALSAVLQLPDETVVDGVTTVGDVEEDVDLLHVLDEAAGDSGALSLLVRLVDYSGINLWEVGGREGEEEAAMSEETKEELHGDCRLWRYFVTEN